MALIGYRSKVMSTAEVPQFSTDRLRMRAWAHADAASLTEIYTDPEITPWLGPVDPAQAGTRIDTYVEHWRRHGYGIWAVEEVESGQFVGRVGFMHHDDWTASDHDAEIGWALLRSAWGRGYATEAALAALDWARARPNLKKIISITRPDNVRSRRVMDKLGLEYRGATVWHGFNQVWYGTDLARGDRRQRPGATPEGDG
jgi:RimJ/RimL family protein N-acetyltransferase